MTPDSFDAMFPSFQVSSTTLILVVLVVGLLFAAFCGVVLYVLRQK